MLFNTSSLLSGILNNSITSLDLNKERFSQAKDFQSIATLSGHASAACSLAILPDGRIVSGFNDGTLRIWDAKSLQSIATLEGHTSYVPALAVLPDGRIVSGSGDSTLRVWDTNSYQSIASLKGHTDSVMALAVLPDGRIVSGSCDNTLRIWDANSYQSAILNGHTASVRALTVLFDGRIVSGSNDKTLRIWDTNTKQCIGILNRHTASVRSVAVLPDGRIVSGSADTTLRIWNSNTKRSIATLNGHTRAVTALAVLPDGRIISGSEDKTLRIWAADSYQCIATLEGHTNSVWALAILPDGRLVSGSQDTTLRVWDGGVPALSLADFNNLIYALKYNTSITSLNIASLSLDSNHVKAIGDLLEVNSTITCLDLSNNSLTDAAANVLLISLQKNSNIISLNLENCLISDAVKNKINELIERNKQSKIKQPPQTNKRQTLNSSSESTASSQNKKHKSNDLPLQNSSSSSSSSLSSHGNILSALSNKPVDKLAIPEEFICIITKELMKDPVVAEDSYSYERKAITKWINERGTSPINPTIKLKLERLIPNKNLRDAIERFRKATGLASTSVSYRVNWSRYLQLSYGDYAGIIPDDKHNVYRQTVAELYQKNKELNYVLCAVGFLYEILDANSKKEKDYGFYTVDVKNSKEPFLHVTPIYGRGPDADRTFLNDLKRYHSEKSEEVEDIFYQSKRYLTFHHSERAFFKHLENPTTITYLIDEFDNQLKTDKPVKVKAIVIDMVSTRYLCKWCEPAMAYFQQPSSPFLTEMAKQLTEPTKGNKQRFQISKKGLFALTRYSAESKGGQEQKTKEEHSTDIVDIKQLRKEGKNIIVQRDNNIIIGEVEKPTIAASRIAMNKL